MNTNDILVSAAQYLKSIEGHIFDVLTISKPISPEAAVNLAKVISKLSPILGNMIEFNTVELLNGQEEFAPFGKWIRQDPGFPDTTFQGSIDPPPGYEIKAWFPLATEMTARFRDSQNHFLRNNISVAILAWLPENLIYGKPQILGVCTVSGLSIANARDSHYHNPPDYLVLEPEDTTSRTRNLQQTNTAGYKWQGTEAEFGIAQQVVDSWGSGGNVYNPTKDYQLKLRELISRYKYRLDTNFAKIDRIVHPEIEEFKRYIYSVKVHGMTVGQWNRLLSSNNEAEIKYALQSRFGIKREDVDEILE